MSKDPQATRNASIKVGENSLVCLYNDKRREEKNDLRVRHVLLKVLSSTTCVQPSTKKKKIPSAALSESMRLSSRTTVRWSPGGGALPRNRLMGMCHWMGSHFHDWIDYNGVAFSIELLE